jgi:hypothetical protein
MFLFIPLNGKSWAVTKNLIEVRYILENTRERILIGDLLTRAKFEVTVLLSLLTVFIDRGVLLDVEKESVLDDSINNELRPCKRLCVCICGSIQAASVLPYLVRLRKEFAETVEVILTQSAGQFVTRQAFEALSFRVWPLESINRDIPVDHIWLAEHCDLVLVLPATANAIHRIASGACCDLLSLVIAATRSPVVVAPSMNPAMWQFPPIRRNLRLLVRSGLYLVEPGIGSVASSGLKITAFGAIGLSELNISNTLLSILKDHIVSSLQSGMGSAQRRLTLEP